MSSLKSEWCGRNRHQKKTIGFKFKGEKKATVFVLDQEDLKIDIKIDQNRTFQEWKLVVEPVMTSFRKEGRPSTAVTSHDAVVAPSRKRDKAG